MSGKLGPYELNSIVTGDARVLAESIPDCSVDLIFTDPPYPKEFLYLYGWLAEIAARVLKPGGLCITLAGHIYLNDIIKMMGNYLDWYWIGGMPNTLGSIGRVHPKQMLCGWKPVLWYSKGKVGSHPYVFDFFKTRTFDKNYHDWGQPVEWFIYYIEKLTRFDTLIFDPFCGGGAVPAACKMLKRNYLAFEIDEPTAESARERVLMTQPPLLLPQPVQLDLLGVSDG